jgi:hypothetical protein
MGGRRREDPAPEETGSAPTTEYGTRTGEQIMELDTFSGGGQSLYPDKLLGHLLLVWAIDYIPHSPTQFTRPDKPSDVIVVDVVDLDTGDVGVQSWWRQSRLIRDLKGRVGKKNPILVAMTKGIASPGSQAPYEMTSMSDNPAAVTKANAWFQNNPGFTPSFLVPTYTPPVPPVTPEPRDTQDPLPPDWARVSAQPAGTPATVTPLPSEPGGPAWLPAKETWPGAQTSAPPYQPPAPARPLTQAERMAQAEGGERAQFGY